MWPAPPTLPVPPAPLLYPTHPQSSSTSFKQTRRNDHSPTTAKGPLLGWQGLSVAVLRSLLTPVPELPPRSPPRSAVLTPWPITKGSSGLHPTSTVAPRLRTLPGRRRRREQEVSTAPTPCLSASVSDFIPFGGGFFLWLRASLAYLTFDILDRIIAIGMIALTWPYPT